MSLSPHSATRKSLSSISSGDSSTSAVMLDANTFIPTGKLHVHAHGLRLIRLPLPSSELTIPIYNDQGELSYVSRREKVCSGNASLIRVVDESSARKNTVNFTIENANISGVPLVESKYFFGPGRDPVLEMLPTDQANDNAPTGVVTVVGGAAPAYSERDNADGEAPPPSYPHDESVPIIDFNDEKKGAVKEPSIRSNVTGSSTLAVQPPVDSAKFKFTGAWTSRSCTFTDPSTNYTFTWQHERAVLANGEKAKLLTLYWEIPSPATDSSKQKSKKTKDTNKVRIAQLVRSASTRTPGTRPSYAGNGGNLEFGKQVRLDAAAVGGFAAVRSDGEKIIDEALVVATCIVMMKKEVDRRRALQFYMVANVIGAAGTGN